MSILTAIIEKTTPRHREVVIYQHTIFERKLRFLFEISFINTTQRANPVRRERFKFRASRDAAFSITSFFIVFKSTDSANPNHNILQIFIYQFNRVGMYVLYYSALTEV
jgi:hypothetical protein